MSVLVHSLDGLKRLSPTLEMNALSQFINWTIIIISHRPTQYVGIDNIL